MYLFERKTRLFETRPGSNTGRLTMVSSMSAPKAPEPPSKPSCGTSSDWNRIETA